MKELASHNIVMARLGQSLELQEVLDAALDEVIHALGAEACTISLVNEQMGELLLCAQRGLRFSHLGTCMPLEQGPFGRAAHTGEAAIIEDIKKDAYLVMSDLVREQARAMALVPIHSRGKTVGVIGAMIRSASDLTERKVALAQAIADQVGAAVENAQLYQTVKEHAAQLERACAHLQETDKKKNEFIQTVSHELRTPLTILNGHVQLLMDEEMGPLTDTQRKSLEVVTRKTEQLVRLVDDIITLEAVSSETLAIESVNLGQLVRIALEGHRPVAAAGGIELQAEVPDGLSPVLADRSRIGQVFDNLLSNAIKFSPRNATITVQVKDKENWLQVIVTDIGIGIPPDKLPHVFDRFYQVDGSSRRRHSGMGLGLAIAKHIVEAHNGHVGVESKVGEGSSFYFTLPKAIHQLDRQSPAGSRRNHSTAGKQTAMPI